ncbi:UNKNOWN [Stylonychia lemnae]|uniref:Uncharacterized protein n=1 Tax=Stylonychia lemnae TaxID=5949 RepID=A0A078B4R0_STYLE|nr:UNKNOWN [Stylonychia lemnae]|eukprot:CDW89251.1 UNKNOWN [Stylonychia lemnae]
MTQDSSPDHQYNNRQLKQALQKAVFSPPLENSRQNNQNLILTDNSSILIKNNSSTGSADMFAKLPFENTSPQLNNQTLNQRQIRNPFVNHNLNNPNTSDSNSSMISTERTKPHQNLQSKQPNQKKTKSKKSKSQSNRNSQTRSQKTKDILTGKPLINKTQPEDTLIQEGVKLLFQKSKPIKDLKSGGHHLAQSLLNKPAIPRSTNKTSIEQKEKEPALKKAKTRSSVNKKTSFSLKRAQTLLDEESYKDQTNIVVPNMRNLNQLHQNFHEQKNSLDFSEYNDELFDVNQLQSQNGFNNFKQHQSQSSNQQDSHENVKQTRAIQIMISFIKHHSKDTKRQYFEKWRFKSLAQRSSVQVLAQTRWINEVQSQSSVTDSEALQKQRDLVLRKCVGCLFRYRSRKLANSFVQWKYRTQFTQYMQNYLKYKQVGLGNNTMSEFSYQQSSPINYQIQQQIMLQQQQKVFQNLPKNNTYVNRQSNGNDYPSSEQDQENISEDEDQETLSKQKKIGLVQNKTVGRSSQKQYNFTNPQAQLDQLPYQFELFKQILQSPNKDFGRLMKMTSENSIQYMNDDMFGDDLSSRRPSHQRQNYPNQIKPYALNQQFQYQQRQVNVQGTLIVKKKLEGQLREVFRIWRRETDIYLISADYKVKKNELLGSLKYSELFSKMKNINDKALIRHIQGAFNAWKITTIIDKKAENKKLQQYFMNNAKLEIQKSKVVLQKLYHQKQLYDQQQQIQERSRSSSPNPFQTNGQQWNQSFNIGNYNSPSTFSQNPNSQRVSGIMSNDHIMQMMNPYFLKNQHALPSRLQQMVVDKNSQLEVVNQIKSLCYDMLLEILDEADKNNKQPTSN